jgi:hypothetical protein
MNAAEFTETVRDANETPLSRLGSSKWVYALTAGEMDGDAVTAAWATEASATRETFEGWAETEASDDAASAFADVAAFAAEQGGDGEVELPPRYDALASLDGTAARAGGFLGWTLVAEKTLAQMVGFFVGDADPSTANTFRERKSALQERRTEAESLLDVVCPGDEAWAAARAGADEVVEAAYADYVDTLESMGIKPKNVC